MSFTVDLELGYEFAVAAPFAEVFALVSDVPHSASFFPKLDRLVPMKRGVYRWEMEPVGPPEAHIQTVYASTYTANKAAGTVVWEPVPGVGNAQVGGSWTVKRLKKGTQLTLRVNGSLMLTLPALVKPVLSPVIAAEFERLTETYLDALIAEWGGEL
jgi:Polyketide cyclase / dehydrase and lipid transport